MEDSYQFSSNSELYYIIEKDAIQANEDNETYSSEGEGFILFQNLPLALIRQPVRLLLHRPGLERLNQ